MNGYLDQALDLSFQLYDKIERAPKNYRLVLLFAAILLGVAGGNTCSLNYAYLGFSGLGGCVFTSLLIVNYYVWRVITTRWEMEEGYYEGSGNVGTSEE